MILGLTTIASNDISDDKPTGRQLPAWIGYAATIAIVAALTGILILIQPYLPLARYPSPYILIIMLVAYLFGEGPAVLAFFLGLFAFDYFFVPPFHTPLPHAETPMGWAALLAFLLGATIVGIATVIMRRSRRRIERIANELRKNQEDLNRAQAVAHTGSWRLDVRRNELLWSDETYRIFGIPKETPMTYESFLASIHPEDRDYVDRKWTAALHGEPYDIEHRIVVDNTVKWVHERAELEFEQGGLLGGFGTVQDITEVKKAEENLLREKEFSESLINSLPGVFYLFDKMGNYLRWNRNLEEVSGYSPQEISVMSPQDFFSSEDRKIVDDAMNQVFTEGQVSVEADLVTKSGRRISYFFTGLRVFIDGVPYLIGSGIDITERKKAEEELKAEQEHKLDFYRRTIMAATDGKLVITERPEIERIAGPPVASWEIHGAEEIKIVRHGVEEVAQSIGLDEPRLGQFIVAVGEAATNAIKHAGGGFASVHRTDDCVMLVVSDRGPGIPALTLPEVALRRGYSTAGTLGMGYKVMIQFTDRVYLATGMEGTTVAVMMILHPAELTPEAELMEKVEF